MVDALNLDSLMTKVKHRYAHNEQRVVGIMLARYDIKPTQELIEQSYQYWHINSKKYFDIFWAGYGEYLCPSDQSFTKQILKFPNNKNRVYFDLEAFIEIKDEFSDCYGIQYEDKIQLILVNYRNGELHFNESIKIDLEESLDLHYAQIRRIMEFITKECKYEHEVAPIAIKMKDDHIWHFIKGITFSDVISKAISIPGII